MSEQFVLESIDPVTDCPTLEIRFSVDSLEELRALISVDEEDPDVEYDYDLSPECAAAIISKYSVRLETSCAHFRLRRWHELDDLPYRVHTDRELALMLKGIKPMAVFSHRSDDELREEKFFEPHVAAGTFVKREFEISYRLQRRGNSSDQDYLYVLYARPHEEWRIDAYITLWHAMFEEGWSAASERMEGMLLGYESWQNDIHIERMKEAQKNKERSKSL